MGTLSLAMQKRGRARCPHPSGNDNLHHLDCLG